MKVQGAENPSLSHSDGMLRRFRSIHPPPSTVVTTDCRAFLCLCAKVAVKQKLNIKTMARADKTPLTLLRLLVFLLTLPNISGDASPVYKIDICLKLRLTIAEILSLHDDKDEVSR